MAKTSMFTRARLQLPLSAPERAFLKILKGLVISALFAGLTAAWPLLQQTAIDWRTVGITGGVAFATTLAFALDKYWTSQGDNPAASLAGDVGTIIQKLGVNDVKTPS